MLRSCALRSSLVTTLSVAVLLLAMVTLPGATVAAQEMSSEEIEVVGLAEDFLSALSAGDTASLAVMMTPGAMLYSVREGSQAPEVRAVARQAFLNSLGGDEQAFIERMWEPEVRVDGRVAMVWTPYDFHLNGDFSHCGIDVFTFLNGPEGWQVVSITYNVRRGGCPPSPLGPVKGG